MTVGRSLRVLGAIVCLVSVSCSGSGEDAAPEETVTSSTTTTTVLVFTGDPDSPFCQLLAESEDRPVLDPFEAGIEPSEVELRFRSLQQRFGAFAEVAPPELAPDIDALVSALDSLGEQLDAAGHDFSVLAETGGDLGEFDDQEFAEVGDRIASYRRQVCS